MASVSDRPPLSEVAHHYWLAKESVPALKYAVLAGEAALSVYANDEAIEHLEHALALLSPERIAERARVAEQLADAHFLVGHYAPAKTLLTDLGREANTVIDGTRIQRKLGEVVAYAEGTPHAAVDIWWTAAQQLGAKRPRAGARFFAQTASALARHLLQRAASPLLPIAAERVRAQAPGGARRHLPSDQSSQLLRRPAAAVSADLSSGECGRSPGGKQRARPGLFHGRGRVLRSGLDEAGAPIWRRGHRGSGALGSPSHIANAHDFRAVVLIENGRWQEAFEHAEQARAGFAACGDHFQLAISLYTILEVLHGRGELDAAVARGREEVSLYERLGLQMIGKGVYTVFGQMLTKSGDLEGIAIGRDVLARAAQGNDKLSTAWAHVALGDSLLQVGRVDEAIDQLERGLAIRDTHRFDMYVVAQGDALLARAYAAKFRQSPQRSAARRDGLSNAACRGRSPLANASHRCGARRGWRVGSCRAFVVSRVRQWRASINPQGWPSSWVRGYGRPGVSRKWSGIDGVRRAYTCGREGEVWCGRTNCCRFVVHDRLSRSPPRRSTRIDK